jgi:hypothetical protein
MRRGRCKGRTTRAEDGVGFGGWAARQQTGVAARHKHTHSTHSFMPWRKEPVCWWPRKMVATLFAFIHSAVNFLLKILRFGRRRRRRRRRARRPSPPPTPARALARKTLHTAARRPCHALPRHAECSGLPVSGLEKDWREASSAAKVASGCEVPESLLLPTAPCNLTWVALFND